MISSARLTPTVKEILVNLQARCWIFTVLREDHGLYEQQDKADLGEMYIQ
jgi:hypothetical protein